MLFRSGPEEAPAITTIGMEEVTIITGGDGPEEARTMNGVAGNRKFF